MVGKERTLLKEEITLYTCYKNSKLLYIKAVNTSFRKKKNYRLRK